MDNHKILYKLEHVHFSYESEEPVLRDINLEIYEGEMLCILGANGSGKSTLLKLLCGLIYPFSGSFEAFGVQIHNNILQKGEFSSEYHRKVGFIFQNSEAQLFCSTVRDELAFGLLQLKLTKEEIEQRIYDISNLLKIGHLLEKAPFKLSGGEKKRVALGTVLVMNPSVLILDEPTNGLDPKTQRWLAGFLNSMNKAGKTIITSTHNLELVGQISHRSVVFNEEHEIAADRATEDILKNLKLLEEVNLY